jgi:4-carboxymuconolactone decarboxylase
MTTRAAFRRTISAVAMIIATCTLGASAPAFERPQAAALTHRANAAPARDAPTVLEQVRFGSPLLSDIVEEFAGRDLGEGPAEGLDDRTREIATAAAFAALGDMEAARRHAANALRHGATNGALREVLYLTAIHAGAPKAIAATRALEELLAD